MKKIFYFLLLLCCGTWLTACDDDDDNTKGQPYIEIIDSPKDFYAAGGEGAIILKSENVTIEAEATVSDWISITKVENTEVRFKVLQNDELLTRHAAIKIIGGTEVKSVTVTQLGNQVPSIENNEVAFDYEGGNKIIKVVHALPFTVSVEGNTPWLTATAATDDITLTAEENGTSGKRTAIVRLKSGDLVSTISVTQTGISLSVETTSVELAADETKARVIKVTSSKPFTAVSGNPEWLTVTAGAADVTLKATENTEETERNTTVTITSGTLTATIAVVQAAAKASDPGTDPDPDPEPGEYGSYESYLGNWTLTGQGLINGASATATYNLTISEKVAGSSYEIKGWGTSGLEEMFPITATYDEGYIFIESQQGLGTFDTGDYGTGTANFLGKIFDPADGKEYIVTGKYGIFGGVFEDDGSVTWVTYDNVTFTGDPVEYPVLGGQYLVTVVYQGQNAYLTYGDDGKPYVRSATMVKGGSNRVFYRTAQIDSNTTFMEAVYHQKKVKALSSVNRVKAVKAKLLK